MENVIWMDLKWLVLKIAQHESHMAQSKKCQNYMFPGFGEIMWTLDSNPALKTTKSSFLTPKIWFRSQKNQFRPIPKVTSELGGLTWPGYTILKDSQLKFYKTYKVARDASQPWPGHIWKFLRCGIMPLVNVKVTSKYNDIFHIKQDFWSVYDSSALS